MRLAQFFPNIRFLIEIKDRSAALVGDCFRTVDVSNEATRSKMSWLQLKGVTRRFGKAEVLSGIDLSLGADEMLVVLGRPARARPRY